MNGASVVSPASRRLAVALAAVALLAAGAVLIALQRIHPSDLWFLPPCMFHALTGLHCPGCGMTRAVLHLLHGDMAAALRCNALVTLALPFLAVAAVWSRWRSQPAANWKPVYTWWLLGVVVVFGIVRNIPIYPFTLLVP